MNYCFAKFLEKAHFMPTKWKNSGELFQSHSHFVNSKSICTQYAKGMLPHSFNFIWLYPFVRNNRNMKTSKKGHELFFFLHSQSPYNRAIFAVIIRKADTKNILVKLFLFYLKTNIEHRRTLHIQESSFFGVELNLISGCYLLNFLWKNCFFVRVWR